VTIANFVAVSALSSRQDTRNERVAWDATFVAGSVIGNVMQVWGAFTAPPRGGPSR
jgi:hypothetical protein